MPPPSSIENNEDFRAFCSGGKSAKIALSDLTARNIALLCCSDNNVNENKGKNMFSVKPLCSRQKMMQQYSNDVAVAIADGKKKKRLQWAKKRRAKSDQSSSSSSLTLHYSPCVLERTDVYCSSSAEEDGVLHMMLRIMDNHPQQRNDNNGNDNSSDDEKKIDAMIIENNTSCSENGNDYGEREEFLKKFLCKLASSLFNNEITAKQQQQQQLKNSTTPLLRHVATIVLQDRLRALLKSSSMNAVAFIADGSILPRKSGASNSPMSCPPALPFRAPDETDLSKILNVDMGVLINYLDESYAGSGYLEKMGEQDGRSEGMLQIRGLVVPKGVTLIVGGGYHGKSTLLRTIAAGVYNKVPGDGRERCVTIEDAVTVRAEDGRYVNNCNVSAFISNLPSMPGADGKTNVIDTTKFSTREASGSTSQASNVIDTVEMGASAMLIDEDVSAANFMARDGRMRALVMDESITPLLYRVNGLYISKGISSVVVVGGVGDWLDVPDNVILMNRYMPNDALKKAQSISRQFSYGHVEYAGRGVVHRLPWDRTGTPLQRRPDKSTINGFHDPEVEVLDGGLRIALLGDDVEDDDNDVDQNSKHLEDDEFGTIDMSRCEQLLGNREQLYGCGLCLAWLLGFAKSNPGLGIRDLLARMDEALDGSEGMRDVLQRFPGIMQTDCLHSIENSLWENIGFAYRPRKFEVAMALSRMRGVRFENVPEEDDEAARAEAEAEREAERRKKELLDLWNNRRKGKNKK